jgi:hypothetical protein
VNRSRNAQRILETCERREEIQVGRPLTWAVQLGMLALVVSAFWLLFRGANMETVLFRSTAALLAFGVAGYAAGRLLESPPKLDPELLETPKERQTPRQSRRRLDLDAVRPGMILAEPARKADGEILIPSDTALTEELLEVMREYEIPSAVVKFAGEGEIHHGEEKAEESAG